MVTEAKSTLVTLVPMTYPAAIQAIAALEERVKAYQNFQRHGATGVEFAITGSHAAIAALREAFGLWPVEAEPTAKLDEYWNRGA